MTATIAEADLRAFQAAYRARIDTVDVVVFSSPQLSLLELRDLAGMLDGRRAAIPLLVVTSPQVKPDADRFGMTARIEAAGGLVLSGMCFYQSYAREMAEANGWQTLVTNVGEAGQYSRRLRLSAGAAVDAGMRRCGVQRDGSRMIEFRAAAAMGEACARPCAGGEGRVFGAL